jgi:hypothetical protein
MTSCLVTVVEGEDPGVELEFRKFQGSYLVVMLLAMFSDWLQGPYGYALYASYGFQQGDIAILYMGGFLSSMVRKKAVAPERTTRVNGSTSKLGPPSSLAAMSVHWRTNLGGGKCVSSTR